MMEAVAPDLRPSDNSVSPHGMETTGKNRTHTGLSVSQGPFEALGMAATATQLGNGTAGCGVSRIKALSRRLIGIGGTANTMSTMVIVQQTVEP